MLRWMRKRHVVKRILWGIAATIVPAFVLWGVGSAIRSGRLSQTVATLDGTKIGANDYHRHLRAVEHFTRLFGGDQARTRINEQMLRTEAWDRTLLLTEVKRRRLTASDQEVIAYVRSLPFLQRPDGGFDLRTYDYVLRHTIGASPREFEDEVREQLAILKLRQTITNEATVTDDEVRARYVAGHQPFRLAYILVKPEENGVIPEPTVEQLRQHYDAHPEQFQVPEQIKIRYVLLPKPTVAPSTPSAEAQGAASASSGSQNLASSAEASPTDSAETGAEGETPETKDGVQKAEEAAEAAEQAERQQTEQAQQRLVSPPHQATASARRRAERLVDHLLADPSQFAAAVQSEGLTAQETGWFGTNDPIPGLGYAKAVADTAFALTVSDITDPIETDDGFVIAQVTDRRAAHRASFEEATDQARADWLLTQRRQAARQQTDALLALFSAAPQLRSSEGEQLREAAARQPGATLEELAAPLGLSVQRTEPVSATGYLSGLGPSSLFAEAVAPLAVGDLAPSVVETPAGFAIVQLAERLPVDEMAWESDRQTLKRELLTERRQRHYEEWLDALRQRVIILTRPEEALDEAAEEDL